ncbi:hypothetical protein BKA66DRAFT_598616 [Pyrenochaeta sp. MPI-SDFR-AT-0127]|nr:hypothetical protein BKA66DRAFT_598616 [Pyrenochaeta sp. MPI-SDFR-AT-0127]
MEEIIRACRKLAVRNDILQHEVIGLRAALVGEKKKRKRGKGMGLFDKERPGEAQFFTPSKVAIVRQRAEEIEIESQLQKSLAEERKVQQAQDKEEKARAKAEKAREREAKKQAKIAEREHAAKQKEERKAERLISKQIQLEKKAQLAAEREAQRKRGGEDLGKPAVKRRKIATQEQAKAPKKSDSNRETGLGESGYGSKFVCSRSWIRSQWVKSGWAGFESFEDRAQKWSSTAGGPCGLPNIVPELPPFPTARESVSPERGERSTKLDDLARLIASLTETIAQQSSIIANQNSITESIRTDLAAIKAEQQYLKSQNAELQEVIGQQQDTINDLHERLKDTQVELKQVHDQLDAITRNQTINGTANSNPSPSYADVARTPPNSSPSNVRSLLSNGTTPSTMTNTLYCTIDVSRVASEDTDKVSAGAIRTTVEKEIRDTNEQTNWRCQAVTMDPRNPHRVRIACRDEDEHKAVKRVVEANLVRN